MSVEGANHAVIPHWLRYALLSLAVFASALVAFLLVAVGWPHKTESKKHVDRVDWLPASASDITYRRRGGFGSFVQYECTLPESNFHVLATNKGWPVQQATNLVIPNWSLDAGTVDPADFDNIERYWRQRRITQAFVFEKRFSNNGGTNIIYNRDRSRLYVLEGNR